MLILDLLTIGLKGDHLDCLSRRTLTLQHIGTKELVGSSRDIVAVRNNMRLILESELGLLTKNRDGSGRPLNATTAGRNSRVVKNVDVISKNQLFDQYYSINRRSRIELGSGDSQSLI